MRLYLGSTLPIKTPQIIRSAIGREYGFGFYTTDITEQDER